MEYSVDQFRLHSLIAIKSLVVLYLVVASTLGGVTQNQLSPEPKSYDEILKIGDSGDRSSIPELQEIFHSFESGCFSMSVAAQMALAHLGDRAAMKSIICELRNDENLEVQSDSFRKLTYVGGYTTIKILSRFLDNSKANNKERYYPGTDVTFGSLGDLARSALQTVAGTPRLPPPGPNQVEGENRLLSLWLQQHDGELKKKLPVFDFDDVRPQECQEIKAELNKPKHQRKPD